MNAQIRRIFTLVLLLLAVVVALWSYSAGGTVRLLLAGAANLGDSGQSLDALRAALGQWGRLAPVIYVVAVVTEVLVAPIPGTLLYAPAGALFGGWWGGTLSLMGNTIGAAIACGVGSALGEEALARRIEGTKFERHRDAVRQRGVWVVLLLRLNPLTSSDIVSYMAGAAGVPIWRVALGTFVGMAPLCYAQAYLSETIFDVLPGALYVLIGVGLLYVLFLVVWFMRSRH